MRIEYDLTYRCTQGYCASVGTVQLFVYSNLAHKNSAILYFEPIQLLEFKIRLAPRNSVNPQSAKHGGANRHLSLCVWHYGTHKQGTFRLFNLHLCSSLVHFNFSFNLLLTNKL
jgi:hypothetical protein